MLDKHYIGHRQRVKDKFLNSNAETLHDYELLELILFWALPRKDVKPLAKDLLNQFQSLKNIINCELEDLLHVEGATKNMYINFAVIKEVLRRYLSPVANEENILTSWNALVDYLKAHMGNLKREQFRVLFLNKKNILIADEIQTKGTVDQTAIYPREVVKRALFHGAGAIILVHNHPSGNPKPSKADIELTELVMHACSHFNITLHDHVIVSQNKIYSFKSNFLL